MSLPTSPAAAPPSHPAPSSGAAAEPLALDCQQTPQEREETRLALSPPARSAPGAEEKRLSAVKKGQKLIAAAKAGDSEEVVFWLAAGADPNYCAPGYSGLHALDYAMGSCSPAGVIALIDAGGAPRNFKKSASQKERRDRAMGLCAREGSLELMEALSERYGEPSAAGWADRLMRSEPGRLTEIAHWLGKAGAVPSVKQWESMIEGGLLEEVQESAGLAQKPGEPEGPGERVASFLKAYAPSAPRAALEAIFGECAWRDHKLGLIALLEAGLRPGPDWRAGVHQFNLEGDMRAPVLSLAAVGAGYRGEESRSECFEILKRIGPAGRAAQETPLAPEDLSDLTIKAGLAYAARGLPINGVNARGESVAHLWARESPSDPGWRALLKAMPELALAPDAQGKSAFEILLSRVKDESEREGHRKALVANERKSLMEESKKSAPRAKAAPAAKPRL